MIALGGEVTNNNQGKEGRDRTMRKSSPWLAKCNNCSSEVLEKETRKHILDENNKKPANQARQLVASESGYGYETSICPEGVPVEFALLLLLAAFGVAFGVLYRALTLTTGKRRKRAGYLVFDSPLADLFWSGWSNAYLLIWDYSSWLSFIGGWV